MMKDDDFSWLVKWPTLGTLTSFIVNFLLL